MTVAGLGRSYELHVPPAHDGRTPLPLVVQFHGYGGNTAEMVFTGLAELGDQEGFVVATPLGRGAKPHWLFADDTPTLDVTTANADVAFVGSLIDRLSRDLCLDTSRIYATGHSNGAWITSALPCALGDRIAAIAPVSGVVDFGAACHPARPVPLIAFHGTADPILPIAGGFDPDLLAELQFDTGGSFGGDDPVWAVPIRDRVAGVAARNGCRPGPASTQVGPDTVRLAWSCPTGADVQLMVHGGGHDWPADATRAIWAFFREHPLTNG